MKKLDVIKEWIPVLTLSFAVFVFGTSEFTPVGLLPDIAKSLGKSESDTGLLLTIYAWVIAIFALPMTMLTARVERKKLIIMILSVFLIGNFCAALSSNFRDIMISRVIVAFSHCVFWSIIPPLAYKISPYGKFSYGISAISGGSILSAVLGIPICTAIGHKYGWNMAFYVISFATLFIILILLTFLPKINLVRVKSTYAFYRIRKNKNLLAGFFIICLFVVGHFTMFTYIVPFLKGVSSYSEDSVVILLIAYGLVGVIGVSFAGKFMAKHMRKIIIYSAFSIGICLFLMSFLGSYKILAAIILLSWGMFISATMPTINAWIIGLNRKDSNLTSAIYSSMFNLGIGGGALLGGIYMDAYGLHNLGYFASIIFIPVVILMMIYVRKYKRKKSIRRNVSLR